MPMTIVNYTYSHIERNIVDVVATLLGKYCEFSIGILSLYKNKGQVVHGNTIIKIKKGFT